MASTQSDAECFTFGEALVEVVKMLRENPNSVLVLEAVLSTRHCENGNPQDRGNFERGRSWYYGAGAVTLIAATRFLKEVDLKLPKNRIVELAEAFLSNKAQRTDHRTDANLIVKNFWKQEPERLRDGIQPLLQIIDGIPPIRSFAFAD